METAPQKDFSYPVLTGALYTIGAIDIVIGAALVFEVYHRMGLPLIAAGVALFVITSNQQLQTLGKRGAKPPPPSEPPDTSHTAQHPSLATPLAAMTKTPEDWPESAHRFLSFAIVAASQQAILSRFESETGLTLADLYSGSEENSQIVVTWLDWVAENFFNANNCICTQ